MDPAIDENQRVRALRLDRFDLSTRAANRIAIQELKTIGDLTCLSAAEIMRWPNAGKKTLAEIRTLLGRIGLKLAGDQFPTGPIDPKLLAEFQIAAAKVAEPGSADSQVADETTISLLRASPEKQLNLVIAIKELQLSARARHALYLAGVTYLGEIAQLTRNHLMELKKSGRTTVRELAAVLSKHGLDFGMTIRDWSRHNVESIRKDLHAERAEVRKHEDKLLLASIGPEPQVLEDELLRIARVFGGNERNSGLLVSLWGWSGAPPKNSGISWQRLRRDARARPADRSAGSQGARQAYIRGACFA
jgi:hypothetical protein